MLSFSMIRRRSTPRHYFLSRSSSAYAQQQPQSPHLLGSPHADPRRLAARVRRLAAISSLHSQRSNLRNFQSINGPFSKSGHQSHFMRLTLPLFSYSYALFCTAQNPNSFRFICFRTLCAKHRGGVFPASLPSQCAEPAPVWSELQTQPPPPGPIRAAPATIQSHLSPLESAFTKKPGWGEGVTAHALGHSLAFVWPTHEMPQHLSIHVDADNLLYTAEFGGTATNSALFAQARVAGMTSPSRWSVEDSSDGRGELTTPADGFFIT